MRRNKTRKYKKPRKKKSRKKRGRGKTNKNMTSKETHKILLSDMSNLHFIRWYGFETGNDEISEDDFESEEEYENHFYP